MDVLSVRPSTLGHAVAAAGVVLSLSGPCWLSRVGVMNVIHYFPPSLFSCPVCGKKVFILKSHMESVHLGVKYPCEKCGKVKAMFERGYWRNPSSLQRWCTENQVRLANISMFLLICRYGFLQEFATPPGLKVHIQTFHEGNKYPCTSEYC